MIRPQVGEFSLRVSSNKEKHSTKVQCLEFRSSDRMYSSLSTSKNHLTRTKSELVVNSVSKYFTSFYLFLIVYILDQNTMYTIVHIILNLFDRDGSDVPAIKFSGR